MDLQIIIVLFWGIWCVENEFIRVEIDAGANHLNESFALSETHHSKRGVRRYVEAFRDVISFWPKAIPRFWFEYGILLNCVFWHSLADYGGEISPSYS